MNKKSVVAGLLMLLLLVSCRNVFESRDPALRLRERVEGFIEARVKNDLAVLQTYFLKPEKACRANFAYEEIVIVSLDFSGDLKLAEVQLKNTIKVMGFEFKGLPQTQQWVWNDNDWFYEVPDKIVNPFAGSNQ